MVVSLKMGDPQVTIGFNTKSWSGLDDLGLHKTSPHGHRKNSHDIPILNPQTKLLKSIRFPVFHDKPTFRVVPAHVYHLSSGC